MDLSKKSRADLITMQQDIEMELKAREDKDKAEARQRLQKAAQESGFSIDELFGPSGRSRKRGPAKIKYRDPKNPENTWAGRGRKPRWLVAQLNKGKKMEDFAV